MAAQSTLSPGKAAALLQSGRAPAGMCVSGVLDLSNEKSPGLPPLPTNLTVDVLNLSGQATLDELPPGLKAYELVVANTALRELPNDLQVEFKLDLSGCDRLERLPRGFTVGSLVLRGCSAISALPEDLDVWFLTMTGCWAFEHWPARATIRGGRMLLRGCTALKSLPDYLGDLSAVNVRDCPNLTSLSPGLKISGWLDIAHSGLNVESRLPGSLDRVQLRWAGVDVTRRIAFRPETIAVEEVLSESNAERRRMLLDRYGYKKLMQDADAIVLDEDRDPGGPRQLLKIVLQGDEDLVALSCYCPSTQRQYVIRVPETVGTCHAAAAWIAGFDNPADYRPMIET